MSEIPPANDNVPPPIEAKADTAQETAVKTAVDAGPPAVVPADSVAIGVAVNDNVAVIDSTNEQALQSDVTGTEASSGQESEDESLGDQHDDSALEDSDEGKSGEKSVNQGGGGEEAAAAFKATPNESKEYEPPPSERARESQQFARKYAGADQWENVVIPVGTRVWTGATSGYVALDSDRANWSDSARQYCERFQIAPHRDLGYREQLTCYVTTEPIEVARSTVEANPEWGAGGGQQLFIPEFGKLVDDGVLEKVGSHSFARATKPSAYVQASADED